MTRTIADIMATEVVSFSPDTNIHTAIHVLLEKRISGAPVLDDAGALVGVLSKKDCLKIVYSAAYHHDRGGPVSDYMRSEAHTSELQSHHDIVSRLLLEKQKKKKKKEYIKLFF